LNVKIALARRVVAATVSVAVLAGAGCSEDRANPPAPTLPSTPQISGPGYRVVRALPHDPQAFTEGLVIADGALFESTGQRGSGSTIRRIDLATGKVVTKVATRRGVFAEGLAVYGQRLYQLTWENHLVLTYDLQLGHLNYLRFSHEGWGLTSDKTRLILSDGTDHLALINPRTLAVSATVRVTDNGAPVTGLNELERVGGDVLANVLGSPRVARIDLASGRVSAWLDLSKLVHAVGATDEDAGLNGIAVDPGTGHLYVTGKLWPTLFELELDQR
jgi:glutamine cyclotransferase